MKHRSFVRANARRGDGMHCWNSGERLPSECVGAHMAERGQGKQLITKRKEKAYWYVRPTT